MNEYINERTSEISMRAALFYSVEMRACESCLLSVSYGFGDVKMFWCQHAEADSGSDVIRVN